MSSLNQPAAALDVEGEVMLLTFHQLPGNKYRPVVMVGAADHPESCEELYRGSWSESLNRAKKQGLKAYFQLYQDRYGFKHPEDPMRGRDRTPLPYTVMSFRTDGRVSATHTFDPDVPVH